MVCGHTGVCGSLILFLLEKKREVKDEIHKRMRV